MVAESYNIIQQSTHATNFLQMRLCTPKVSNFSPNSRISENLGFLATSFVFFLIFRRKNFQHAKIYDDDACENAHIQSS